MDFAPNWEPPFRGIITHAAWRELAVAWGESVRSISQWRRIPQGRFLGLGIMLGYQAYIEAHLFNRISTHNTALTFAGLRYSLAFVCLLPLALRRSQRLALRNIDRRQWLLLVLYGLGFYAIVQGAQFVGLAYLPAATVSLLLNFTSIIVAFMGLVWLGERPGWLGWVGIGLSVLGSLIFFYPADFPSSQLLGLSVVVIGVFANAGSSVLGRYINHRENLPALQVTTVSMGIGGALLLLSGGLFQGLPRLEFTHWLIIAWLAVVNTAFAFTLWNHTLRTLAAMESSIINSTMLIQIALLAWIFLGEGLSPQEWSGMFLAALGTLLVQLRPRRRALTGLDSEPGRKQNPRIG
jgi:drug/metabolite transporter (DMT)-like permease